MWLEKRKIGPEAIACPALLLHFRDCRWPATTSYYYPEQQAHVHTCAHKRPADLCLSREGKGSEGGWCTVYESVPRCM